MVGDMNGRRDCLARHNGSVPCDGAYMPSEGLCLRHAVLFDVWIAHGGFHVYGYRPMEPGARLSPIRTPTIGPSNPPRLRAWKRRQFHRWLDRLTLVQVRRIESS